jgi:hypothetical protein
MTPTPINPPADSPMPAAVPTDSAAKAEALVNRFEPTRPAVPPIVFGPNDDPFFLALIPRRHLVLDMLPAGRLRELIVAAEAFRKIAEEKPAAPWASFDLFDLGGKVTAAVYDLAEAGLVEIFSCSCRGRFFGLARAK